MRPKLRSIIGWVGVSITVILSSIWAYWGAVENFHEGWYSLSIWDNLFMFIFQYMIFTIGFVLLGLVTLRWKKLGFLLHLALGGFCAWFFSGASFEVLYLTIIIPFVILGLLYLFGDPRPVRAAYLMIIGIPLAITLACTIPLGIRDAHRINDHDFGMRVVEGNGLTLAWAPRGPGWPDAGVSWDEARMICAHLSEDGLTIVEEELGIWRLPTVDEAVRSMQLHGEAAGGEWDASKQKAVYERTPDKETPLWDVNSPIIYYWTAETSAEDETQAYIITYDGGIYDKKKAFGTGSQGFRAVKTLP